jgi:CBS domain containing-hemolysin-like protein
MSGATTLGLAAAAAVALLAAAWQWREDARPGGAVAAEAAFWLGAAAWIAIGRIAGAFGVEFLPLAAIGLAAHGALHALRRDRFRARRAGSRAAAALEAGIADEPSGLDLEDRRLARRLLSLQRRPAAQWMVPLARARTLREDATADEAVALLRRAAVTRVPVLDRTGRRVAGVIDGRDLLAWMYPSGDAPGPPPDLGRACRPMPRVRAEQTMPAVLEALRGSPAGTVAVVDADDGVLGFLTWDVLFGALLGRRPGEVEL